LGVLFYRKIGLAILRRFDRYFVTSEYMKSNLVSNGFSSGAIHIVSPYVDSCNQEITENSISSLLVVGRLDENKGVALLPEILSRMSEDCVLVVVGDGPMREELCVSFAERGLSSRVVFRGWLDACETLEAYRQSRVVVFPSLWEEPFGRVGLEAMAAGKPVVAFDVGGVREWLQPDVNGFLVPRGDVDLMAEKISTLLGSDQLAHEMGAAGQRIASECFSRDRIVEKFLKVLEADAKSNGFC
jgi:glycosyltransferase involved in cell wall biosynthesis